MSEHTRVEAESRQHMTDAERTMSDVLRKGFPSVATADKSRMRTRVLERAKSDARTLRVRAAFSRAAMAFAVLAGVLGGATYASAQSLPGDRLYGLKRAAEEARVALLPPGLGRRVALESIARSRSAELMELMRRGASPAVLGSARAELAHALQRVHPATPAGIGLGPDGSGPVGPSASREDTRPPGLAKRSEGSSTGAGTAKGKPPAKRPPRSDRADEAGDPGQASEGAAPNGGIGRSLGPTNAPGAGRRSETASPPGASDR